MSFKESWCVALRPRSPGRWTVVGGILPSFLGAACAPLWLVGKSPKSINIWFMSGFSVRIAHFQFVVFQVYLSIFLWEGWSIMGGIQPCVSGRGNGLCILDKGCPHASRVEWSVPGELSCAAKNSLFLQYRNHLCANWIVHRPRSPVGLAAGWWFLVAYKIS